MIERRLFAKLCLVSGLAGAIPAFGLAAEDHTDVVILSTTDMHGKCWGTDLLTDASVANTMLRVSTAVSQFRQAYGDQNVLLIDNGDLFQGTQISEMQLADFGDGVSSMPPAMALCLSEIGYDAFVLGNHEFNFDWQTMRAVYRYLETGGVPVLAANVVYDETDGVSARGDNVFTPYIVKSIHVVGREHKIGILGLENSDITQWDVQSHYPGMAFSHPGNEDHSMSFEASLYIPQMLDEGCEFIVVSYHGGIGDTDQALAFGMNSANQGMRLAAETDGIDLLILGHDHTSGYSNTRVPGPTGRDVLVVNGGGQELTKTEIRFSEDENGALTWEILDSANLKLADFDIDEALEAKIEPYAELTAIRVSEPIGTATGEWDENTNFFTEQTDTIDLVNAATMDYATRRLLVAFGDADMTGVEGLDHLDVDVSITGNTVRGGYVVTPGDLSLRDMYRLYQYPNSVLVIPMTGRQIRSAVEFNAANRLVARVLDGEVYVFSMQDDYTHMIFGGLNFYYDMSMPVGERACIEGFSNGRPFVDDGIYLVAVNNYMLGNSQGGLAEYGVQDAIWSQEGSDVDTVQGCLAEYVSQRTAAEGSLTTNPFDWHWSVEYTVDPSELPRYTGEVAARLVETPEEGHRYVIYQESEGRTLTARPKESGLDAVPCAAHGDVLAAPLDADVQVFTVRSYEDGAIAILNADGLYLTSSGKNDLFLAEEMDPDGGSLWLLERTDGGWNIVSSTDSTSTGGKLAMQVYRDKVVTYSIANSSVYLFNFYELAEG